VQHTSQVEFEMHEVLGKTMVHGVPVKPCTQKTKDELNVRIKCMRMNQGDSLMKVRFNSVAEF
jgi:hypothetical protein